MAATMKMYVLVRDSIPLGFAMVAVAHAPLGCYLRYKDTPEVAEWLSGSEAPCANAFVADLNATVRDLLPTAWDRVLSEDFLAP